MPPQERPLLMGSYAGHCNVPEHECIKHCSSAAVGECACPAHAADECIRRREGWKNGRCGLLPNNFTHLLFLLLTDSLSAET